MDEGAEPVPLAPPKPPAPPATTGAVLKELNDEDSVLENDVCVCEALVLGKLDEEIEPWELECDNEAVGEAPLVCEELSLVDVVKVLFPLVAKVAWLRVLVPENEVVGTASKQLSASLWVKYGRKALTRGGIAAADTWRELSASCLSRD